MLELFPLTDTDVRKLGGRNLYERAIGALGSGKIVDRRAFKNGILSGRWDGRSEAPLAAVILSEDETELDCTCPEMMNRAVCVHSVALALAWARSADTFVRQNRDIDIEKLLDEHEAISLDDGFAENDFGEDTGEDDELADEPAAPTPGRPAPSPTQMVERVATTLTWERPSLRDEYRALLANLTVIELRELARRRDVKLVGTKREPLVETLAEALGKPQSILEAWGTLSGTARLALGLAQFVDTPSGVHPQQLRQLAQSFSSKPANALDPALEELTSAGLAFDHFGFLRVPAGMFYLFPPDADLARPVRDARDLRELKAPGPLEFAAFMLRLLLALKADGAGLRLAAHVPHPLQKQVPELQAWPVVATELDAVANSRNLYNSLYTNKFSVPPAPPLLSEASAQALARTLDTTPLQIEFGLRLLAKMGIVDLAAGGSPAVRDDGFMQYISHHPAQHLAPLFSAWINLRDWSEQDWLWTRQPNLRLRRTGVAITYAQLVATLVNSRLYLMHQLRRAPAGQWIDVDGLVERARELNLLQAVWPVPNGFWLELNGRRLKLTNAEDWRAVYGAFVEIVLSGPLHAMGLVDLGYRKTHLAAFRLTELGAFLLYQQEKYTAPPVTRTGHALTYAPDGALQVEPAAADPRLLGLLSQLGEPQAGRQGTLVYRVTVAGATRAFEAGSDPDKILALLEQAAGAPPPQPLSRQLRQWWEHFGDAHLYGDLALVELADDFALTELLAATSLSKYLLYRFSPRLVAVRPEGVAALGEELARKGYTPKIVEG